MGMCKGCGVVYSALVMKNGYYRDCKPELFSEDELKQTIENEGIIINTKKEENTKEEIQDSQTCGIVSCVLGILSLFTGAIGIIFAIIGLICGLKNSKNTFGIIGIIVSSIYLIVFLLGALGLVSILAMN